MKRLWALQFAFAASVLAGGFTNLPLAFERNEGQAPSWAEYVARGPGYAVALSGREAVLAFAKENGKPHVVRMKLVGAGTHAVGEAVEKLPGVSHYFAGKDPSAWRTNVQQFARVSFSGVYPGVNTAFYGNQGQLEYDFEIAPGADPNQIELEFAGVSAVRVDGNGDVLLRTGDGEARLHSPIIYQRVGGERRTMHGRHRLQGNRVRFEIEKYDPRYALVIDPVLTYSTSLSGGRAGLRDLAVDSGGSTYVTGCASPGFTMVTPYLDDFTDRDVVIAKLSPDGSTVLYSTYLGGGCGASIAVDSAGGILVAGTTSSQYFPVRNPASSRQSGSFLARLNPDGSELVYSTYLRGDSSDIVTGVAVDPAGNAFVTRMTAFSGFKPTVDLPPIKAPQQDVASPRTAVLEKYAPAGALDFSASIGNGVAANAIAVDRAGAPYVTGATCEQAPTTSDGVAAVAKECDAFIAKIHPDAGGFAYLLTLGGGGWDGATNIALDSDNNAYITGTTFSADFPVTSGAPQVSLKGPWDAFAAKVSAAGDRVIYATYLGGSREETPTGIAVDSAGRATILGTTSSGDFPLSNALRPKRNGAAEPLHISDDAGGSWTGVRPHGGIYRPGRGSIYALVGSPVQPATVYAADRTSVYRSTDGGLTWTTMSADSTQPAILALTAHPSSPNGLYATSATGIRYSADGGTTWSDLGAFSTTGTSREVNLLISRANPDALYVFLRRPTDPRLLKSVDAGQTWNEVAGELPKGVQAMAIDPSSENTLYLGADAGLFKTTDGGASWQSSGASTCVPDGFGACQYQEIAVAPSNPRVLFFTRRGGRDYGYTNQQCELYKSVDGGQTWTFSRVPILADATAVSIDPSDPNVIYLGFGGTGVGSAIFRSLDGGVKWASVGALASFWTDPINAITVLPLNPSRVLAAISTTSEGFVTTLDAEGSTLIHSSFLGGPGSDSTFGVRSDDAGVYVLVGTSVQRIDYAAPGCDVVVEQLLINSHFQGNASRIQVRAATGCDWSAQSSADWISVISPSAGQGTGAVEIMVAANATGHARTVELVVNGQPVTVTQGGGSPCTLTPELVRVLSNAPAREGFALTYTAGCRWKATSTVPWIIVGTGMGGPTNWVVPYTVEAHTGKSARQGSITITSEGESATATHTVLQMAAGCSVKVTGSADRVPASGGTVTVQLVSQPSDCAAWYADSGVSWATPLPGVVPAGMGDGNVTFRILPNTLPLERAVRIQMGGVGIKVTQDAVDCAYTLAPATQSIDSALFTSILNVYAPSGCAWTAASDSSWLRVTSVTPPRGGTFAAGPTGNGRVYYRADVNNTGAVRVGNIAIGGRKFTLTQAPAVVAP